MDEFNQGNSNTFNLTSRKVVPADHPQDLVVKIVEAVTAGTKVSVPYRVGAQVFGITLNLMTVDVASQTDKTPTVTLDNNMLLIGKAIDTQ